MNDADEILPKKEDEGPVEAPTSVRIPKKLLERLDAACADANQSRNEGILHMLRWAVSEIEKRKQSKSATMKRK